MPDPKSEFEPVLHRGRLRLPDQHRNPRHEERERSAKGPRIAVRRRSIKRNGGKYQRPDQRHNHPCTKGMTEQEQYPRWIAEPSRHHRHQVQRHKQEGEHDQMRCQTAGHRQRALQWSHGLRDAEVRQSEVDQRQEHSRGTGGAEHAGLPISGTFAPIDGRPIFLKDDRTQE